MIQEQEYQAALAEMQYKNFNKQIWLIDNFELYKNTLIWPPGLPPTKRCNMMEGTFRERFHSTYKRILNEFDFELDNEKRSLEFL